MEKNHKYNDFNIKFFGEVIHVKFFKQVFDTDGSWMYGMCDDDGTITIRISLYTKNNKHVSDNAIRTTILHELLHIFMNNGQYQRYSQNEALVEWLAKSFNELFMNDKNILTYYTDNA